MSRTKSMRASTSFNEVNELSIYICLLFVVSIFKLFTENIFDFLFRL